MVPHSYAEQRIVSSCSKLWVIKRIFNLIMFNTNVILHLWCNVLRWRGKTLHQEMRFFGGDSPLLASAATVVCWGGAGLSVKPLHAPIRQRLVERGGCQRGATIGFKPYRRLSSLIRSDLINYRWTKVRLSIEGEYNIVLRGWVLAYVDTFGVENPNIATSTT